MIIYQLRFKKLPRFEKFFASQDALFAYIDACDPQIGHYQVKVREIPDKFIKVAPASGAGR